MEKVLLQAELLAEAILESKEYIQMRLCEQAAMKDEEATRLVAAYSEKRQNVEKVLSADQLDHDELAKAGEELEAAEGAVDKYAALQEMQEARTAFGEMMRKVNGIIQYVVTGEEPKAEGGGCGGSCSSCSGCH